MKKGTKLYVILGYNNEIDTWYGYVENSFSMGTDTHRIRTFSVCKGDFPFENRPFPERKRIAKSYLKEFGYKRNFAYARDYLIDAKMNPNSANQWIYFYLRDIVDNLNKKTL